MPYITCPNGKTYSRYSNENEAKECIANEKKHNQEILQACLETPSCKEKLEFDKIALSTIILTLIVISAFTIYKVLKNK
jgi:hypothetical protein